MMIQSIMTAAAHYNNISTTMKNSAQTHSQPEIPRSKQAKRQKISQMKHKMKYIMSKMNQLENQKRNDLQEFQKLMGESEQLQKITNLQIETCEEMKQSSIIKNNENHQHTSPLASPRLNSPRLTSPPQTSPRLTAPTPASTKIITLPRSPPKYPSSGLSSSKQSKKDRSSKIKLAPEVELQKNKVYKETIRNYIIAIVVGILVIMVMKAVVGRNF